MYFKYLSAKKTLSEINSFSSYGYEVILFDLPLTY